VRNLRRTTNYSKLIAHFEGQTFDEAGADAPQYAAVAEEFFDETRVGARILLCDTLDDALAGLGDSVLDGYAPDGVYDLETGEKIDICVAAPVVTRAEGPSATYNPLTDD
jgi:hypothetical protein